MIAPQPSESIRRSISCNDLKKRKMLGLNPNNPKIVFSHSKTKNKERETQPHIVLPACHNKCYSYNAKDYLEKLITAIKSADRKSDNYFMQNYEHTHKGHQPQKHIELSKIPENNSSNTAPQHKNICLQKIVSMSSLPRKSCKMLALTNKPVPNTLKRTAMLTQLPSIDRDKSVHELCKKYNTAPQTSQQPRHPKSPKQPTRQKQNIFFNSISPIPSKSHRHKPPLELISQISGFSLLEDIPENKPSTHEQPHQRPHQELLPLDPELKIKKINKKGLPSDFFIRV